MFTRFGRITPETLGSSTLAPRMKEARVFETATRLADASLSDDRKGSAKPTRLSKGVLTFSCRSSAAAFALRRAEHGMLEALHREHPGTGIESLRFIIMPWKR